MPDNPATAVHITDQENHLVGIGNLRVNLVQDGTYWYAHGMEIDYVAQGATIEEAKKNFEVGLRMTIDENLRVHGTLERMLRPAPAEVWAELLGPQSHAKRYFQVSKHSIADVNDEIARNLPFQGIDYIRGVEHG